MTSNVYGPKIVATPFVRPDVEYCSPQYDRMSSCPADLEHVNGSGGGLGGGRVCTSASWSGDIRRQKSRTKDRAAGVRVDVDGEDVVTPISDDEVGESVEEPLTSSTSSGISACKMIEDGSGNAASQSGSPVNEASNGFESDLNGNDKPAIETNNNKSSNSQPLQTDGSLNR